MDKHLKLKELLNDFANRPLRLANWPTIFQHPIGHTEMQKTPMFLIKLAKKHDVASVWPIEVFVRKNAQNEGFGHGLATDWPKFFIGVFACFRFS